MKRISTTAAAAGLALATAFSAAAADVSQLSAGPDISAAEAGGMTLTELAALKFNNDSGRDEQQTVPATASPINVDPMRHAQLIAAAGLSADTAGDLTLGQLTSSKHNAEARRDDVQIIVVSTRGPVVASPRLVAAAGLSPAEAHTMTLTEIAAVKFNRDSGRDETQTSGY